MDKELIERQIRLMEEITLSGRMESLRKEIDNFKKNLERIEEAWHDPDWEKAGYTDADAYSAVMYRAQIFFARVKELV